MRRTRREFLHDSLLASGAAVAGLGTVPGLTSAETVSPPPAPAVAPRPAGAPPRARRILVLGGTGFIGPHIIRAALSRGHTLSMFNRGRSNPGLFPEVEELYGDRNDNLEALKGRTWDVCIDTSATDPKWVRLSADLLRDAVEHYLFTSTRSVYSDFTRVGMTALDAPLFEVDPEALERGERLDYGRNKALCEYFTRNAFGERALIVRPGLIVGPGDNTDRFTYWPVRIARGGEVLAPGDGSDPCMFIDVRDLAAWYVRLIEEGTTGRFNALTPAGGLRFDHLLYGIKAVTSAEVTFTWVDADFCRRHNVRPYAEMPLWYPARGNRAGFARFDLSREIAAGLSWRPLADTARDTLEWHRTLPEELQQNLRGSSLRPDHERRVLEAWRARGNRYPLT